MKGVIVQVSSDRPQAPEADAPHGAELEHLEILVVDDSYHMRRLLRTLLQALKVRHVREAENGADALAALQSSIIDVVLADCQMQPVDGIQLAQKIRRSEKLPNPAVPIIMISGHSSPELIARARDVGVHEFLLKPVSATALQERILSVLARPRPFVRSAGYVGPCRRRRDRQNYNGPERRGSDRRAKTD